MPLAKVPVPSVVAPSLKVTKPDGDTPPETVAVKVTFVPALTLNPELVTTMVVVFSEMV